MSEALPETRPVQSSEWMMAIRDYQFTVTPHEFAIGSLYGTCGNWGQRVWLSDVSVENILHIKRETVSKVRKSLLAKGLIEDIGQHGKQPSQREYRLTLPVEMPPARDFKGDAPQTDTPLPTGTALYGGDAPQTDTPVPPKRTGDAPLGGHKS